MNNHQGGFNGSNGMGMNNSNDNDDSFEEAKRNKKKKNKMQKVDPNLLGFQCNAAPELMNRAGEIESMAETLGKVLALVNQIKIFLTYISLGEPSHDPEWLMWVLRKK